MESAGSIDNIFRGNCPYFQTMIMANRLQAFQISRVAIILHNQNHSRLHARLQTIIKRLTNRLGPLWCKIKLNRVFIGQTIHSCIIIQPILHHATSLFTPNLLIFFFLMQVYSKNCTRR